MSVLRMAVQLLVLGLMPLTAAGQEIYIWTDEDGVRHFSDRRPGGDYEIEVQRAIAEPRQAVTMRNIGRRDAPQWRFANRLGGVVTVEVRLTEADNVVTEPPLPVRLAVPANGHRDVLVGAFDETRGWRYGIEMQAVPGPLNPEIDAEAVYPLPFSGPVRIGQGFGGPFSHTSAQARHAVDFSLPVGTPVVAAREGVVMDAERWFSGNGRDLERDGPRANHVRILHDDGSMAVYAHLEYNGVSVRPGQRVRVGQEIGRSGNTGYSTGPHLHFAVQVNRDMELVSIPFRMLAADHAELDLRDPASP